MASPLSFSAINKYLSCPEEYNLYYNERLRPGQISSAFWFGGAVDKAFSVMLTTKNLDKTLQAFNSIFTNDASISYNENDVDEDLITSEQQAAAGYYSLKVKGEVILTTLFEEVLPRIKKVVALQERVTITNDKGQTMPIIADLVCEWEDGRTILFDLKTSIIEYEKDSASNSSQLSLYYHFLKQKYNIDAIGFIVARKLLKKNRIKVCSECSYDGSGANHRTCPNKRSNGRCNAKWIQTIRPEAYIQIIINQPNEHFINIMLDSTDKVSDNIQNGNFYKNLTKCKRGKYKCDYFDYCHNNSMNGLIKKT